MKRNKLSQQTAVFIFSAFAASACNDNNLTPLVPNEILQLNYVTVDAQFCTSEPKEAQQKIKYVFVLDHSQSNQPGFPLVAGEPVAADPNGALRYGPVSQFIANLTPDPNNLTSFALIDFNDNAYFPNNPTAFDTSSSDFLTNILYPDWEGCYDSTGNIVTPCLGTALSPEPQDTGFTNYTSALQATLNFITSDLENEALTQSTPPIKISYQIIFVSDGVPIVQNGSSTYTQQFTADIQPIISNIMNLTSNTTYAPLISSIALNTVYYYTTTQIVAAEALLGQMANAGLGQYNSFAAGASIVYQQFAPPVRNVKYNLADAWVENENAVWWDNGELMVDSDGDGLPDQIETQLGSNPFAADSDGNGVSDLVEYRTKGAPCNGLQCNPASRDPYAICDGFSPSVSTNGTVTFPYTSNDGLNQCEKFVLGANQTNFDSNGDFIPDYMSFRNSIPFIFGTTGAFLNPFGDPLNNYGKLKAGLPISISQNKVLNFTARATSLEHIASTTSDNQCYHMVVNNVAILNGGNTIKVSIIQNEALIENAPVLQTAVRTLDGQSSPVYFVPSDFN